MINQVRTTEKTIPLSQIKTGRYQQRKTFDVTELRGLVRTIKNDGLMTPPLVVAVNGHYELIAGDRRRRALYALALEADGQSLDEALTWVCGPTVDQLPERFPVLHQALARVNLSHETDPATLRSLATIENLQRVDLSPLEKAEGFQSLLDDGLTLAEVVERTGERVSSIKPYLALLKLPGPVQAHFDKKRIPLDALKELGKLPPEVQIEVADKMVGRKSHDIKVLARMVQKKLANFPDVARGDHGTSTGPAAKMEEGEVSLDLGDVEAEAGAAAAAQTRPASIKEQLAQARDIITKLTMQLHLDGRLLAQCAEELGACAPDSRLALMAKARAQQIERAIKQRRQTPLAAQVQRGLKIERFMEKRQYGARRRDAQPG